MDDLISRRAAIDLVKSRSYDLSEREDEWAMVQDVEELPSAQPQQVTGKLNADCISRKAAIDALNNILANYVPYLHGLTETIPLDCAVAIKTLPSAQPEIIRCKDCKYHGCNTCGHKLGLIAAFDNDFCSYAERRTDETD